MPIGEGNPYADPKTGKPTDYRKWYKFEMEKARKEEAERKRTMTPDEYEKHLRGLEQLHKRWGLE